MFRLASVQRRPAVHRTIAARLLGRRRLTRRTRVRSGLARGRRACGELTWANATEMIEPGHGTTPVRGVTGVVGVWLRGVEPTHSAITGGATAEVFHNSSASSRGFLGSGPPAGQSMPD